MAFKLADKVKETCTCTGLGGIFLSGAMARSITFASGIGDGVSTYYSMEDPTGTEWEVGVGTYVASTNKITRDSCLSSSNANAFVSFTATTLEVWVDAPAAFLRVASTVTTNTLSITKVNASQYEAYSLVTPQSVVINNVKTDYSGKWVGVLITYNDPTVTSLTFDDLEGSTGSIVAAFVLPLLQVLSFPVLKVILSSFTPSTYVSLTTLNMPQLTFIISQFAPSNMPSLTTMTLTNFAYVGNAFTPSSMPLLTSLTVNNLKYVETNFAPATMALLTTFQANALEFVGGQFSPTTMGALTSLAFNSLVTVGTTFTPTTMASLTTFQFNALVNVGSNFNPSVMGALTTISMSALANVGGTITITSMAALTSVSFPAIVSVIGVISFISGTAALNTFTLGTTLKSVGGNVTFTSAALTQASVDGILARLASLDGTGGTTAYSSKTVTLTGTSATPSAAGLASKAILVARGCTVTHN